MKSFMTSASPEAGGDVVSPGGDVVGVDEGVELPPHAARAIKVNDSAAIRVSFMVRLLSLEGFERVVQSDWSVPVRKPNERSASVTGTSASVPPTRSPY
jgi:hypothetical protein